MAVNPLSTPLKTEYKPLGLEAFAQPLSDMQARFDTAKAEIEATDFALSRLSQDDPRAKDLLKEIEGKRDELAENLMNTGNYRQASSKLLAINKAYNKDEETLAIKGNYDNYQKAVKEQKERVGKGDITQKDYDLWDFRVKNSFKGTNYDANADTYTSINLHPRMKNMEKELREESLKLAGMAPEQVVEELKRQNINAFTREDIQILQKSKKLPQVAREIEQFLRTSDQYKNWINEDADYKWYYNTNNDPTFKEDYINSVIDQYDQRIADYSQYLQDPTKAAQAQKEIERLKTNQTDLINLANQSMQDGTFDGFAKSVFFDQAEGRYKATAFGAADIVDMESLTMDLSQHSDEKAKGRADNAIKKLEEIGSIGTNLAANSGQPGTTIISGTATNTAAENVIVNYRKDAFTQMKVTTLDDVSDIPKKGTEYVQEAYKPQVEGVQNTSKDLHVTLDRMNKFDKAIKNSDKEIELKKDALAKAASPEERKMLTTELNDMYQNKEELRLAFMDDTRTFDNIIGAEINADYVTPELKKKFEQEYQNDPAGFLRYIRNSCNEYLTRALSPVTSAASARDEASRQWHLEHPDMSLTPEQEEQMFGPLAIISGAPELTPEVKFANSVMKAYNWNLSSSFDAIGSEAIMNKNLDAMTDGAAVEIVDYVKNNSRGASDVKKVDYNLLTGAAKEDIKGNKFDLAAYNETPHYAGVDKNGDIILRYVLKSDYDPQTATSKSAIANFLKTTKGAADTETINPTAEQIAGWRESNPTNLYVSVKGRSKQLTENATKNYTDIAEAGIAYNDGEVITQNLNNYAPIHLISNPERKENYYKMAARLKDAVDNDHKFTEMVQAPAAWNQNADGSYTAYQITYKVVDRQIQAQINQGTMDKSGKVSWNPLTVKTLESMGQNLPSALVAMDLTYGTGREEDLVHTQRNFDNIIFVPAFENPGIAIQNTQPVTYGNYGASGYQNTVFGPK